MIYSFSCLSSYLHVRASFVSCDITSYTRIMFADPSLFPNKKIVSYLLLKLFFRAL